jgi:glutamate--cysteine ligase
MNDYKINTKAELEHFVCVNWNAISNFIDEWQNGQPIPIYSSVDVRESIFKYAPVDHNMYPAGFNNICSKDLTTCSILFRNAFNGTKKGAVKIGLIPESHTKNKFYLENILKLKETIENAGCVVHVISPDSAFFPEESIHLELEAISGAKVHVHKVISNQNELQMISDPKYQFDIIVLNHDQSHPLSVDWKNLVTPVLPSPFVGWFKRQKIHHFKHYETVANKFAEHFGINPDLIQAKFRYSENVDFESKDGLDSMAQEVDQLISELPKGSSVFVKASQGTYGMGISVVTSGADIIQMNRKGRNKMDMGKNNLKFTSVLIQEGIETVVKHENSPAEVTIYLINGRCGGGFIRFNPERGTQANLNSQGMLYQKLCLSDIQENHEHKCKEAIYSVIARLSTIAAAYEIKENSEGNL